ncbi:Mitochondrial genome maintenance protein MGM101 [Ceratocystis fimbriata CBS 114723]|uniref:Mitochondrial genome maintenance protein MGM101 n=1 Tax=Ceratocystis fimbriata CBS 114723 TaxID=1035309 RepID=A0A2C5WUJ7_9PEZI|nr:Mitochondrial genome maintenance protein MGM101 [Ceratocystis fimbriata CBS 114723]
MASLRSFRALSRSFSRNTIIARIPAAARPLSVSVPRFNDDTTSALAESDSSASSLTEQAVSRNTPTHIDWTTSYYGLATEPFSKEVTAILTRTVDPKLDVEMKPDGIIYMPEVRYRRVLNEAFGPGGWGLVPRGDTVVGDKIVTREYALIVHGRFISQAQGENNFFSVDQIPRAVEGCKSNALMRCCKDLGIAWQLWDPQFIRRYQTTQAEQVWVEHVVNKKKARIWIKKGDPVPYPYKKTV